MPNLLLSNIIKEVITPDYWREVGNDFMAELMEFQHSLKKKYPQLEELNLGGAKNRSISINSIRVKKEYHGQGVGSQVIKEIKEFAKKINLPITLTPEADIGKKEALKNFYKNNGFKKCKDPKYTNMFGPILIWYP